MFSRLLACLFATCLLAASGFSQEAPPSEAPAKVEAASSVDGLELPPDHSVNPDEGFVNVAAKCKGQVKWLVVSASKVKYLTVPSSNSIIISVPPGGGVVSVFAVGLVEGKLTDFARTNITVAGDPSPDPGPEPGPNPNPVPPPVEGPLHVTFLVDLSKSTPELAQLLNSKTLRDAITSRNSYFRLYDINSPVVAQKKLDKHVKKVGGSAVLIIQSHDGRVLVSQPVPKTEQEVINLLKKEIGG